MPYDKVTNRKAQERVKGEATGLSVMFIAMGVAGIVGIAHAAIAAHTIADSGAMIIVGSGLVGLAGWGRRKFRK